MKRVIIDVGKDEYCVSSKDNNGKQIYSKEIVAIELVAAIDRMILSGCAENLIMDIVKQTYGQRYEQLK